MSNAGWTAYKAFVDTLSAEFGDFDTVGRLAALDAKLKKGPPADDLRQIARMAKDLCDQLNDQQREAIDALLRYANERGVASALYGLEQLREEKRLKLVVDGARLPLEPCRGSFMTFWEDRKAAAPWPDEKTCPVHACGLEVEAVPVVYGLVRWGGDYITAEKERFPLANAVVLGGCFVGSQRTELIVFCPECRKALAAWATETGSHFGLPRDVAAFLARYAPQT
jgi:hypothetical protein